MHNLSSENEFYLHENEKWFPYQRLSTYPCFETEAGGTQKWPITAVKSFKLGMWKRCLHLAIEDIQFCANNGICKGNEELDFGPQSFPIKNFVEYPPQGD